MTTVLEERTQQPLHLIEANLVLQVDELRDLRDQVTGIFAQVDVTDVLIVGESVNNFEAERGLTLNPNQVRMLALLAGVGLQVMNVETLGRAFDAKRRESLTEQPTAAFGNRQVTKKHVGPTKSVGTHVALADYARFRDAAAVSRQTLSDWQRDAMLAALHSQKGNHD